MHNRSGRVLAIFLAATIAVSGFAGLPAYASPADGPATGGVIATTSIAATEGVAASAGVIATDGVAATEGVIEIGNVIASGGVMATEAVIATDANIATPGTGEQGDAEAAEAGEWLGAAEVVVSELAKMLATPGSLTATKSGEAALLKWDEVAGATGYNIYRSVGSAGFEKLADSAAASYMDSALVMGHTYRYKVAAYAQEGQLGYESGTVIFEYRKPAPANLKPKLATKKAGAFKVQLIWDVNEGETYKLYRKPKTAGDSAYELVFGGEQGELTASGTDYSAMPGTEYSYALSAVRNGEETLRGAVLNVKTSAVTKPRVASVRTVAANRLNATVNWVAAKTVEGAEVSYYQIFRKGPNDADFTSITGNRPLGLINKSVPDYDVMPGATYSYKVVSVWQIPIENAGGTMWRAAKIESAVYTFKAPAMPKVKNLKATAMSSTSIKLTWARLGAGEAGYEASIYKAENKKPVGAAIQTPIQTHTTSVTFEKLPYGDYILMVRPKWLLADTSLTPAEAEVFGETVKTGVANPKGTAVTTLKATVANPYRVDVEWKALPTIKDVKTAYYIYKSSANNKNAVKIPINSLPGKDGKLTFTDINVAPGETYYYYVQTGYLPKGAKPEEELAGKPSARKVVKPVAKAPARLKASYIEATSFELKWDKVAGADSYEILVAGKILDADTNTRKIRLADGMRIFPNTYYTAQVRAVWGNKPGKYSTAVTVKTAGTAPSGLRAEDVTETDARISWNEVIGAHGYIVRKNGVILRDDVKLDEFYTERGIVDPALQPGLPVKYTVQAYWEVYDDAADITRAMPGATSKAITVTPKGKVPTNLKATNITATSVSLSWSSNSEVTKSYAIYVDGKKWPDDMIMGAGKTNCSGLVEHLDPSKTHKISVAGIWVDDKGINHYGKQSTAISVKMAGDAPKNLRKNAVSETKATLEWDQVYGAQGYVIERDGVVLKRLEGLKYTDDELKPGYSYTYNVRACFGEDKKPGVLSKPLKVTAGGGVPAKLKIEAAPTSITASWQTSGTANYNVYLRQGSGDEMTEKCESATGTSHTFSGLDPNAQYKLIVAGVWGTGESAVEGKPTNAVTVKTGGAAPKSLKAKDISEISATLAWASVAGASEYIVSKNDVFLATSGNLSFPDNSLEPGIAVTYKVQAVWPGSGKPGPAATLKVTPRGGAPKNLRVKEIGLTEATLTWSAVNGVSGYRVSAVDEQGVTAKEITVQEPSASLDGLSPYTQYSFKVSGVWSPGGANPRAGLPAVVKARTSGSAPKGLKVVKDSLTETSVTLTWDAVDGASGYIVERGGVQVGKPVPANNPAGLVIEDNDLKPGVAVKYTVCATWEIGEGKTVKKGGPGAPLSVTPKGGAAPTGLKAQARPMNLTISWKTVPNTSWYRVYLYDNAKAEPGKHIAVSAFSANEADIPAAEGFETLSYRFNKDNFPGIAPNTTYYARVVGVWELKAKDRREGRYSAPLKALTSGAAPNMLAANDIEPNADSSLRLRVTWNAVNDRNVKGYLVAKTVDGKKQEPKYITVAGYYKDNGFLDTASPGEKLAYTVQACWGDAGDGARPGKASAALKVTMPK